MSREPGTRRDEHGVARTSAALLVLAALLLAALICLALLSWFARAS